MTYTYQVDMNVLYVYPRYGIFWHIYLEYVKKVYMYAIWICTY
jgi:hypothetical protein